MADWDTSNPTDNAIVAQFPANERAARTALATNFAVNHRGTNDGNVGKHTVVELLEQSAQTATAGMGKLYAVDTAGRSELFWISDTGSPIQITSGANGLLVNASNILSGTLPDARLSANVPLLNASNTFLGSNLNQMIRAADETGFPRWTISDSAGNRVMELAYAGSASGGVYGSSQDGVVLNVSGNASAGLTISTNDTARIQISAAGVIALNGVNVTDYARLSQNNVFTGGITVGGSGLAISGAAGTERGPIFQTSGVNRWWMRGADSTTESGGDAGSNFTLSSYSDAGVFLGNPISIVRSTGVVSLNGVPQTDFARLSQSNTFTNAQTLSDATPQLIFIETDAAADNKRWDFVAASERLLFRVLNDALSPVTWFTVDRTGTTVDQVTFTGTTLRFDGADLFANSRLWVESNTNSTTAPGARVGGSGATSTAGTLSVVRSGTTNFVVRDLTNSVEGLLQTASTGVFIGSVTNHTLTIGTGNSSRYEINSSGNHDFKSGTVTIGGAATLTSTLGVTGAVTAATIANSTSTTLVAGQLHFITGNATLPNLAAGEWVQVINDSGSAITISKNGSDTTYWTTTGASVSTSFTLAARGVLTARCSPAGNAVYVSGSGITGAT